MNSPSHLALFTVAALAGFAIAPATAAATTPSPRAATQSSPWAQADSDAAHSRSNRTEHTLTPSSVRNLHYRRTITAPPSRSGPFCPPFGVQSPVLSGGRVFGIIGGRVASYNASTGALIWRGPKNPSGLTGYNSVSVSHGLVVVSSASCDSASDPEGVLRAFRAGTGAPVWSTVESYGAFDTVVSGHTVLTAEFGNGGDTLTEAQDLASGALIWQRDTNGCQAPVLRSLVVGGLAVFASCTPNYGPSLIGADLATGRTVWQRPGSFTVQAGDSATTSAQHLYVKNSAGRVLDLNPATGATQRALAGATHVLAVAGIRTFTTCSAGVCAYLADTGARSWTRHSSATLAAAAAGVLYLSDGNAVNAYTGGTLHRIFSQSAATALVVGDGRVGAVTAPRILDLYGLAGS